LFQSAYLIFSQAECKKIRAANPEMGVADVMKEAAARWAQLDQVNIPTLKTYIIVMKPK
jgi:hypothetical protein